MEASRTRSVYFVAATLHTYGVAVARAAPRGPHAPGRARDGAGAVLWQDAELVFARQLRMLGDDGPAMKDHKATGVAQDLRRSAT